MNRHIPMGGIMFLALNAIAAGASIGFNTDPFEGTTVRSTPGRQVVGGELFIAFHTATEAFVFDGSVFGIGNQINFFNGPINAVPSTGINVVVLQTTDNDANPLTAFGAANAADLLASQITDSGPGFFIYFNSGLNLARLVYSTDLGDNTADLKILARMLNLTGQEGIDALPTFSAANFALAEPSAVPEPSSLLMSGGITGLLVFGATRRRFAFGGKVQKWRRPFALSCWGSCASLPDSSSSRRSEQIVCNRCSHF